MLRITIHDKAEVTSFDLEGELASPRVKVLEKCWEARWLLNPCRKMVVNLAAITFIDAEGRALLTRMRRSGARLSSHGVLIDTIVTKIDAEEKRETAECSRIERD